MAESIQKHLKSYLEPADIQHNSELVRSNSSDVASVAMTVYMFIDYMCDEIELAGYSSNEFSTKSEYLLKSVTPSCKLSVFRDILITFKEIDPNFSKSKFLRGLRGLRALCVGDHTSIIELVDKDGKLKVVEKHNIHKTLIFFATFLVENIIRFIRKFRIEHDLKNIEIKEIRKKIDEHFDTCVINTVSQL